MLRRAMRQHMKGLVTCKRAIDYQVKVSIKSDGKVDKDVKHSLNPFCEIAVEEAVRMKEAKILKEVVAVTIGGPKSVEVLRSSALVTGADRGIHITLPSDDMDLEPLVVAKLLKAVVDKESPDVVMMGKQAIDGDNCSTPQMLAGLLGWPQATFAAKIGVDGKTATVERETDTGIQTQKVDLPAVFSADLRLNKPRFLKLQLIKKARSKPLDTMTPEELGVSDISPRVTIEEYSPPAEKAAGVKVDSAEDLFGKVKGILVQ
eukprot:NODE_1363_length_890_cov_78.301442_g1317_i0.p1 GENE.NODE_1363_length_890_cov_78.301442_g1317_i0~~NODE_1363_length_890_cov_78.301442_g1317_i0.p1  ORF type:complete len:261 (-),score=52.35 NODE_1363_length_890_cov_78.301442_g1317_i0:46-828(-)